MKELVNLSSKGLICLILIISSCNGKDNSKESAEVDSVTNSVNYNGPVQRDSTHIDSSFRNGLGY